MEIIRHRVNTIEELRGLDPNWGAEIDLRSRGERIVLQHDPFKDGDDFAEFVAVWAAARRTGTLILNPKEDGLETRAMELLRAKGITNYFFLDLTLPTLVRMAIREGVRETAVRHSEYEPLESVVPFEGKAAWVWIDCFRGEPASADRLRSLKGRFRLCAVSPELHGYPADRISGFLGMRPFLDAVCTKHPASWLKS